MKRDLRQAAKAVAAAGRHGDTELVHLSKTEKALLALALGAGTINPATGLEEHFNWLDPIGIIPKITQSAEHDIPGFKGIHAALAKIPGSPSAFIEASRMPSSGNPFGAEKSAFDVWGGGTSWANDPEKRRLGRMAGTAAAMYFGGPALYSAAMGGGEVAAGAAELYGPSALEMGVPGATGYAAPYAAGAGTMAAGAELMGPSAVEMGVPGATGYAAPYAEGSGQLYNAAAYNNAGQYNYNNPELMGPSAVEMGVPGATGYSAPYAPQMNFFQNMMRDYGIQGTPGETTMQRMWRLAKGAGRLYNVGSGVMGLYQANQMRQLAKPGQEAAKRMAYLESNPTAIQGLPGYAAGKASMIQARDRLLAQQGQTGGGMALEATMKSEGAYDAQVRNAEMQRLQSVAQGGVGAQTNYAELVSRALASIGYAFGPQNPGRR